jgi:hypothetical protein
MSKKIAILQSNYIPWKGYFDLIAAVDEFILFDDMQYTKRDWRNRNLIKTEQGLKWLTIPVKVKGRYFQTIQETEIDGDEWARVHWRTIQNFYSKTPYFKSLSQLFESVFLTKKHVFLSELNCSLIELICAYLDIRTKITKSSDYVSCEGKTERLASLCQQAGGDEYLSGPSARDYIDESIFKAKNIKLSWFDYNGYPEYPQLFGKFEHGVSILDLLFNCGKDARKYMRYVAK